jgi:hypothetical protein
MASIVFKEFLGTNTKVTRKHVWGSGSRMRNHALKAAFLSRTLFVTGRALLQNYAAEKFVFGDCTKRRYLFYDERGFDLLKSTTDY